MSRTGSIRKMDRRRYWRVRAEFLRWWDKRPPKHRIIAHWLWWRKRPKGFTKEEYEELLKW